MRIEPTSCRVLSMRTACRPPVALPAARVWVHGTLRPICGLVRTSNEPGTSAPQSTTIMLTAAWRPRSTVRYRSRSRAVGDHPVAMLPSFAPDDEVGCDEAAVGRPCESSSAPLPAAYEGEAIAAAVIATAAPIVAVRSSATLIRAIDAPSPYVVVGRPPDIRCAAPWGRAGVGAPAG